MIKFKLSIPKDVFDAIRELPTRSVRKFNDDLRTTVRPALQRAVKDLIIEPGPTVTPFKFGTDKSRRYYFWKFKGAIPYQRTHALINAWVVDLSRQSDKNYIQIYNAAPAAQYVYGNQFRQAVAGHIRTGWPRELPTAFGLIQERAIDLIIDSWYKAVKEALP